MHQLKIARRIGFGMVLAGLTLACMPAYAHKIVYEDNVVEVPGPPPPEQYEPMPPAPSEQMAWAPGHWRWAGNEWVWDKGHYVERPVAEAIWVPGHWIYRHWGSSWVPGHWQ